MPRAKSKIIPEDVNPDYVRMYYEHQYDRIKTHEEQSLTISNFVLTISALIITFGLNNKQAFGSVFILFVPVIVIAANVFAILNVVDRTRWMVQHQQRAKRVLEIYMPKLYALDKEIVAPHNKWAVGRRRVQGVLHYSFLFISVALLVLFVLEIFGVPLP
jgi:hypothetical protein